MFQMKQIADNLYEKQWTYAFSQLQIYSVVINITSLFVALKDRKWWCHLGILWI